MLRWLGKFSKVFELSDKKELNNLCNANSILLKKRALLRCNLQLI